MEQLRRVDLSSGAVKILTSHISWDIEASHAATTAISRLGGERRWLSQLTVINLSTRRRSAAADGQIGRAFDRTGKRLALSLETAIARCSCRTRTQFWCDTRRRGGARRPAAVLPAELVRYPTFDRANGKNAIAAFVFRPRTPGPHPVYIDTFGPESIHTGLQCIPQFLVRELGFCDRANVRSSPAMAGFRPRQRRGSRNSVKDIGALLGGSVCRRTGRQSVLSPGGSYGGYMSLASMVNFATGCAVASSASPTSSLPREHLGLSP